MQRPWISFALTPALFLALLSGCENKPRAPVLATEAVYTNDAIGLTFVAPDGWLVYAKSNLPPGEPLNRPMRMMGYHKTEGGTRSEFELYAIEPGDSPVLDYLAKNPIGTDKWGLKGSPESVTINGVQATRYSLTSTRAEMRRELTAFNRGGRTYIFLLTHQGSDAKFREQTRRAIETAVWK